MAPAEGAQLVALTVGPDKELWFTDAHTKIIGKINDSGAIREFSEPTTHSPHGITVDHDGRVWFSEPEAGVLGTVDLTGAITEYEIGVSTTDMAVAIDGTIWMTSGQDSRVVKIDKKGTITRYSTFVGVFCR
jgi:virginiamycin B lyase